jgi:glyoxylase-like metal-dependent hydrolase (beta-lactamase superfamily II)
MKIDCLILGAFETNCYVLRDSATVTHCLIIDPGLQAEQLIDFLQGHKLNPVAAVLTHGHADHIAGVALLRKNFPQIKVYVHKHDATMLVEPTHNLSAFAGRLIKAGQADVLLQDGDIIEQAGIRLHVLHTPGHTPGGICLYCEDDGIVFTDDTLFAESVGRTDFPGGSMSQLLESIGQKLLTLPEKTRVCPGHGPETTIAREKAHNPFLQ